jgi:outer membrane protein assembly factor BamB
MIRSMRLSCAPAAFLTALVALPSIGRAAPEDGGGWWPQFHGPNRDGMSSETGLLKRWPEGGPRLAWRFPECGKGYAGVSIAGGRIFTAGDFNRVELILALDLNGKLIWKAENGASWRGSTPGARATPTCADGTVYHMNPTGRVAAYDAATGKDLWHVDLRERFEARHGAWGFAENIVVDGNAVLCVPGGDKGRVVALDKATGATLWANTTIDDSAAYCSPLVVTHGGVRQLVTLMRSAVVGIEVATGKLLWRHPHQAPYGMNCTMPKYHDGSVFVASGHNTGGRLIRIVGEAGGSAAHEVWFNNDLDNCHGGVIILGDYLYGSGCRLHHDGLRCVQLSSGKTMPPLGSLGKVALTYADGLLYCVDQKGRVSLVKPDPKGSSVLSSFALPPMSKDDVLAHPVVCGGRLYLRHAENLYAYEVRAAAGE